MIIIFLRHGIAEEYAPDKSDRDRKLTAEGIEKMTRIARVIGKLGWKMDCIITSPYLRALKTAEIVADTLGMKDNLQKDSRLAPGFSMSDLARIVAEHANASAIMLVGHNPSMSVIPGELCGGANLSLKKGGIAWVETSIVQSGAGMLQTLLTPGIMLRCNPA
jgi:phosphohistidine phosphatase